MSHNNDLLRNSFNYSNLDLNTLTDEMHHSYDDTDRLEGSNAVKDLGESLVKDIDKKAEEMTKLNDAKVFKNTVDSIHNDIFVEENKNTNLSNFNHALFDGIEHTTAVNDSKRGLRLLPLMKLALGCPLKFKKECIKQLDLGLIVGRNVSNLYIKAKKLIVGQNVSNLYIKAKNSSERAFLDLVNSFAMSRDFIVKMKYAFGKKLPQDVATDFMKNLKLAFMDLCAAGPADMEKVKTNFDMVKDHITKECMKLNIDPKNYLDDVAAKFNTIFSQKMQAHEEIMSANNKVVEALKDSKNFDFSKFEPGNQHQRSLLLLRYHSHKYTPSGSR